MLPGTATRGNVAFLHTLNSTAAPAPRMIAPPERRVVHGGGVVLALFLAIPMWLCAIAIVWASWPVIRAAAAVARSVLWVVAL